MKYFLGMKIHQCEVRLFIAQQKYALKFLKKYHMKSSKPIATPLVVNDKLSNNEVGSKEDASVHRRLIGSLLDLCATRLDLMFSTSLLLRFMHSPSQNHLGAAKRVLSGIFPWNSRKQEVVVQSSAKAEYILLSSCKPSNLIEEIVDRFGAKPRRC
ncbi:UNVERIFIED_CONTAM: hypothetical protein Sindi_1026300 [Sesamum indicum]